MTSSLINSKSPRYDSQYCLKLDVDKNYDITKPIILNWIVSGEGHPDWLGHFELPVFSL